MSAPAPSPQAPEPGRVPLPRTPSDQAGWIRWLPGLQTLRRYEIAWLRNDIAAGLVLATMLVPVGIAYAVASGVPGIYGLYATIVPLLAYALFGPSRILVLGPDSALVAVILAVIVQQSGGDPMRAIALASMMAIVSGVVSVAAGLARLGFITELLSKPIRYGYMNGIALTVLISQLPKLFGFKIESVGPLKDLWSIATAVFDGRANWTTFTVGAATLAVILLLKGHKRIPGILIAVVGATIAVGVLDLGAHANVAILGSLPQGLPALAIPWITAADIVPVLTGGCAVALVAFADTSVLSRVYAARTRTQVDPNQEMVGLGVANLAAGFFQGFPISSSSSRTPVAEAAGAKTQLTGVVGALAVALLLMLAPDLLRNLPTSALAAVVIASAIGLFEFADLGRIYRIQRWEFWLSIVCFLGVALIGVIQGIFPVDDILKNVHQPFHFCFRASPVLRGKGVDGQVLDPFFGAAPDRLEHEFGRDDDAGHVHRSVHFLDGPAAREAEDLAPLGVDRIDLSRKSAGHDIAEDHLTPLPKGSGSTDHGDRLGIEDVIKRLG